MSVNTYAIIFGIGASDFYKSNFTRQQAFIDNRSGSDTDNNPVINVGNQDRNNNPDNVTNNTTDNTTNNNINLNNEDINESVSLYCEEGYERVEVSDTEPGAGQTITLMGYCWDPNQYIEIAFRNMGGSNSTGGNSTELIIGKVKPDKNGNFKINVRLSKTYGYGDIIEILCGDERYLKAVLQIID